MGLADELRKNEPVNLEMPVGQEMPQNSEMAVPASENFQNNLENQSPEAAIQAVQAEIQGAEEIAQPQSIEDQQKENFAKVISDILLNEKEEPLISFVREDKKQEFEQELDKFIIENFWDGRKDEKLDQEKLGKLLLDFYLVYLNDINEFFAAQMAFKDANKLMKYFKSQTN